MQRSLQADVFNECCILVFSFRFFYVVYFVIHVLCKCFYRKIKFSFIYRHVCSKKKYVIQSKIPDVTYVCPAFENIELSCHVVNKCFGIKLPTSCHNLITKIASEAFLGECSEYMWKMPLIDLEFLTNIENTLVYNWVTTEKYKRKNLHDYSGVEARASFSN